MVTSISFTNLTLVQTSETWTTTPQPLEPKPFGQYCVFIGPDLPCDPDTTPSGTIRIGNATTYLELLADGSHSIVGSMAPEDRDKSVAAWCDLAASVFASTGWLRARLKRLEARALEEEV